MARFCTMAIERDLFGQVVLVRRWGRINGASRTRLDEHRGEGEAGEAMASLEGLEIAKRRRGYKPHRVA
jgi:predicted DNA-binding WGR domain protein